MPQFSESWVLRRPIIAAASHSYLAYRARGVNDKSSWLVLPIKHAGLELKRARFALQNVVPVAGLRFILRECRLK
jgi:hypothetical protein